MALYDKIDNLKKAFSVNSDVATAPTYTAQAAKSTGGGLLLNAEKRNLLAIFPFGTDTANEAFDLWAIGWRYASTGFAVSTRLLHVACTLGTTSGASGKFLGTDELYADTLVVKGGKPYEIFSPADNTAASVFVDTRAYTDIEIYIDVDDANTGNALYGWL